jgi:hypothetical protein
MALQLLLLLLLAGNVAGLAWWAAQTPPGRDATKPDPPDRSRGD